MPSATAHAFHALHHRDQLLMLPSAWDAASAALWQRAGAAAIGTSSAALAWSSGYADGGALPEQVLLQRIAEIAAAVSVPLSVDLEDGYSDAPDAVARLVERIAALGVAGINLEDGSGPPQRLVAKLEAIRRRRGARALFINARTDVYLGGLASGTEAVRISCERLCRYAQAGADGGFVPGLCAPAQIAAIAAGIPLPLNLMAVPDLPEVAQLRAAGVRRLSAGPALFLGTFAHALAIGRSFIDAGCVADGTPASLDYAAMNALHRSRPAMAAGTGAAT